MNERTHPVTVRLDRQLREDVSAISRVTGETFREIVERGLRREVRERLEDGRLADAVRSIRDYGHGPKPMEA